MDDETTTAARGDGASAQAEQASAEVVDLLQRLVRVPSINHGGGRAENEREAAELVEGELRDAGLEPQLYESEPGRVSLVCRLDGADPSRTDALLVHGHLDVVPVEEDRWSVDPFAGELRDGMVWGRGCVDMKDMDAMTVALVRAYAQGEQRPDRPLVVAMLADEEAGGHLGAGHLVREHPELFEDCTEGIGEVGGFSLQLGQRRAYLVETEQKGMAWMRLHAEGRGGHGSLSHPDNPVVALAGALERLGRHRQPARLSETVRRLFGEVVDAFGLDVDVEGEAEDVLAGLRDALGPAASMFEAMGRSTLNPTMVSGSGKVNVVPSRAEAQVDGRFVPGDEEALVACVDELLGPDVTREWVNLDHAVQTTPDGPLWDRMVAALQAEDPDARVVPYLLTGGTDAKHFSRLGIRCFGFSPLRLPPDLDFFGMFHGADERVPVDALHFGVRVLDRFLRSA